MNREDIICPGETIKELLEVYNYTQRDLADKLGMDLKTVNEILNGKAPITADTAIKLELIFNIEANFWNNLEFNYRKDLKYFEEQELIEAEYELIKNVYKEMIKRNLIEDTKDKIKAVENFKKFMEITTIKGLELEYNKISCRQTTIKNFDIISLMVWIQIGLRKAREAKIKEYSKETIIYEIDNIRKLTMLENQEKAREKLVEICNNCGIILNFEKSMPNTAIYGISKWLNSTTPFIQVSDRGKNVATFWFTFMHELGHILYGRKKVCFIDMADNNVENRAIIKQVDEFRADKFSRDALIPEKEYKAFLDTIENNGLTKQAIIDFAEKIGISPCIVAGRIKFDTNKFNNKLLNSFNIKIEF